MPPACLMPASLVPPLAKFFISIVEKKNYDCEEFYFRMGTVLVIFSFFWMDNAPCLPHACSPGSPISKIFYILEKKNYNCEEFYFRMGTVLVIFSFCWIDNDLVNAPPSPEWYPHYVDTTIMFILRRIAHKLLGRFSWNFGTLFQTI